MLSYSNVFHIKGMGLTIPNTPTNIGNGSTRLVAMRPSPIPKRSRCCFRATTGVFARNCFSIPSRGMLGFPYARRWCHMSHVLNPCVHVKQGAPCRGVA